MFYDYFLIIDGEKVGIIQGDGFMKAYRTDGGEFIGTIKGNLKDYKNGEDSALVDLSNIDDDKLIENLNK